MRVMRYVLCCCLVMGLMIVPGCQKQAPYAESNAKKTISFLTMQLQPTFNEYVNSMIAQYEASHPDVKVTWLDYPADQYETKLLALFISHDPPDVINLSYDMMLKFCQRDVLLGLDDVLTSETFSRYFEKIFEEGCRYEGTTYALPWYLALPVTMYNEEIFREAGLDPDKPPVTYEEMADYCRIVKAKTDKYGTLPIYTEVGSLKGYLLQDGVPLVDKTGKRPAFNTPQGVETLTFWANLYKEGLVPREALSARHRRPIELYQSGKIAFFCSGPQFLKLIKGDAPEVYKHTGIGPRLQGKVEMYPVDLMVVSVASETKYSKISADFAAYVTNGENQLALCKLATVLPSVKWAAEDPYFVDVEDTPEGQARKVSAQQLPKATILVTPLEHRAELDEAIDTATEKACLGVLTPKEALDEAAAKWTQILSE
jgi:putative chitobiose transport system substrate-binding protein